MKILLLLLLPGLACSQTYWEHLKANAPAWGLSLGAGYANGVGDVLQFKYSSSVFPQEGSGEKVLWGGHQYWNPAVSWKNKYQDYPNDTGSRFPMSKSGLVWATDGWHMSKTVQLTLMQVGVVTYKPPEKWGHKVLDVILMKVLFSAGWNLANETLLRD